jgi:hypothetical protein
MRRRDAGERPFIPGGSPRCSAQDRRERPAFPEIAYGHRPRRARELPCSTRRAPPAAQGHEPGHLGAFSFAQVKAGEGAIMRALAPSSSTGVQLQVGGAIWPLLVALIAPPRSPEPPYVAQALALLETLAKRPQYLALIQDVPNLHTFVLPETLGIFFVYHIIFPDGYRAKNCQSSEKYRDPREFDGD